VLQRNRREGNEAVRVSGAKRGKLLILELDQLFGDVAIRLVPECIDAKGPSYSTRYRKAKASKGLTGSFGDRSWPRKTII